MSVTKRTRYEVLRRDGFTCRYCHATDSPLRVDHVIPVALGGSDDPSNLVAACVDCNAGKASVGPDQNQVDDVAADALRWSKAMEAALHTMSANAEMERDYQDAFEMTWNQWVSKGTQEPLPLPDTWRSSLTRWQHLGVDQTLLHAALDKAMSKPLRNDHIFRYFAGIVWRMIDDARQQAAQLLEGTSA